MTDNQLPSTINQDELNEFLSRNKVSQEDLKGGGDFLPQLRVNYMDEDKNSKGETVELKPGFFALTVNDVTVYAKNVTFRPLLQNFQYIDYDKDKEEVVNRSVLFNDFSDEPRDETGTLRCGKPPSKVLRENPDLKKQWDHVNLYRSIDGLTTITGLDVDGVEHTFENVVSTFRGKGTNFSPFQEEYTDLLPKGTMLWDYELKLSTTKHKQDPKSAVNYFITHFEADYSKRLPFTLELFETAKELERRITATNKEIDKKYYAAVEARETVKAVDKVLDLDAEFGKDDIPF